MTEEQMRKSVNIVFKKLYMSVLLPEKLFHQSQYKGLKTQSLTMQVCFFIIYILDIQR